MIIDSEDDCGNKLGEVDLANVCFIRMLYAGSAGNEDDCGNKLGEVDLVNVCFIRMLYRGSADFALGISPHCFCNRRLNVQHTM